MRTLTRIKVSGITDPQDAERAADLGADIVACVFHAASPRYVSMPQAWQVASALPAHVTFAGIFANAPIPIVLHIAGYLQLKMVQLWGNETRADVDAVGPSAHKAITVRTPTEIEDSVREFMGRRARGHSNPAIMLHLAEAVAQEWQLVSGPAAHSPIILAADRLGPDNVAQAIAAAKPWAIDVWEAVESEPGRLDPSRLAELVAAARSSEEQPRPNSTDN